MCQLYIYMIVTVSLGILTVSPVFAAKIKHQGSVYSDSAGVSLKHPEGVACGDNYFIVADTENSRLVRYSMSPQGLMPEAVFPLSKSFPLIAQMNSKGDIYILDGKTRTIVKLSQEGQVIGKLEPKGLPGSKTFIPRSFTIDKEDNIYLLDIFSERLVVLDPAGKYLRHLAFPKGHGFFSDLAISPQGSVYLLDSVAGAIYVATSDAEDFTSLTSSLKENMNFPTSLAIDSKGMLYLSDQYGSGLALVGRDGSFMGRKFSQGWEDGQLYYPSQVCINDQNTLIIADRNSNRVQVFSILED